MPTKKQLVTAVLVALSLVTISGWLTGWVSAYSPDYYHQVQKNIEIFGRVYQEISKKYVEEVDPEKFMKAGINGMLATLDPYTVLVEKEDSEELQIMSSGKYGGLGMRIGMRANWPTVVEPPYDGTPSMKAGIREGDRIIEVDGESTNSLPVSKVANMLRGEIGSEVFLKVEREGDVHPIEFRLIRAEIVVTDVVYAGLVDKESGIGMIRLSHFSRNAGKDIETAIRKLKKEGLQRLILDLRSNPGGLLDAAVSVSENFIEKGKMIVSTEGRTANSVQKFHSEKKPILGDMPLVVLVNGLSASASEIVAGAIQDLDRGVIIGTNTFGKGLVQTVIPITGESALKVTTAKYLVPSGRSIQDPRRFLPDPEEILYEPGNENVVSEQAAKREEEGDEAEAPGQTYYTERGRKVFASHGISPDIVVEPEPLSQFEVELLRKTMPFQFAVVYAAQHPELERGFKVSDELLTAFRAFLREKGFDYTSEAEATLAHLEKLAEKNSYLESIGGSVASIRQTLAVAKDNEFDKSIDFIREELREEISAKLWGSIAEIEASLETDPAIRKAVSVLKDRTEYAAILSVAKAEMK